MSALFSVQNHGGDSKSSFHDLKNQRLTSSSLILFSNPAIFSAFSSFASPSLGASFSVEYVRLAANTLEATELDGLACRLTILRSGCSDDNERDIVCICVYVYRWNNRLNLENPKSSLCRFRCITYEMTRGCVVVVIITLYSN
jgi:hypothetical protein